MQNITENDKDKELIEKINGVYKEILSNSLYIIGCYNPREINKDDIETLCEALKRLYELKEEYTQCVSDRRPLGNRISDLASCLQILVNRVQDEVRCDVDRYQSAKELFVEDFEKIIYVLFNAQNSPDFAMKKVYASGIGSFKEKHGTVESKEITGVVYIIGDATSLLELEDDKVYGERDINEFVTKLLTGGKSTVVASDYYYSTNLIPYTSMNQCLEIKGSNPIYCYLGDDVIKTVVTRFLAYALENGNHINDIPDTEILSNITIDSKKRVNDKK